MHEQDEPDRRTDEQTARTQQTQQTQQTQARPSTDRSATQRRSLRLAEVAHELGRTATALGGEDEVPTLETVVRVALDTVTSADSVSTMSLRQGTFSTTAATDDLARQGDALQYSLGSGPCIDAVLDESIYHPEDLEHDTRWPQFGRQVAQELGIHSMLSFRLYTQTEGSIDGLNFYAKAPHAFDDDDLLRGLLLASQAALALTRTKAQHLAKALGSSRDIGAATGILMSTHKVTYDEAFGLLRVASQHANRPLRLIAEDVVRTGQLELRP